MSKKFSLMLYFPLDDFLFTILANQIIGQNTNLFSITLRFFLDLLYMCLFELSNANLSSTTLGFISHAFTAEFKLLAFSVVLVCCVGIPHPHFVRLVSSDHSLPILYIFLFILLCTSPKINFNSREFLL